MKTILKIICLCAILLSSLLTNSLGITPSLMYSTYLGGANEDRVNAIAVDSAGNVYLTGLTVSDSFPGTGAAGIFDANRSAPSTDAFITKLSPAGTLLWSTYLGGAGIDIGNAIAIDGSGIIYVTGETTSVDFSTAGPQYQAGNQGGTDAFVTALNADGTGLAYSAYLGGAGEDFGYGIAVDTAGNAYVTGGSGSNAGTFPQTTYAYQPANASAPVSDVFVCKLSSAGAVEYSTFLGGTTADIGRAIAIDGAGNAYVAGQATAAFPIFPPAAVFKPTITGASDAFISKISSSGANLLYSTYAGGSVVDDAFGIALDGADSDTLNVYITGYTYSDDFPKIGFAATGKVVGQTAISTAPDAYVFKLNMNGGGGNLDGVYSTYLGAGTDDRANAIAVDAAGNAYVAGLTTSINFPLVNPIQDTNIAPGPGRMVFVTEISSSGAVKIFSTYLGGVTDQEGKGIGLDGSANIYAAGWTSSTDFSTAAAMQPVNAGSKDGFVTKISATELKLISVTISPVTYYSFGSLEMGISSITNTGITITNTGNVIERYIVNCTTVTPGTTWSPGSTPGLDTFVLKAGLHPSKPGLAQFGPEDVIYSSGTTASDAVYSIDGTQKGNNVEVSGVRTMWNLLEMPSDTSIAGEQRIRIYITAEEQP